VRSGCLLEHPACEGVQSWTRVREWKSISAWVPPITGGGTAVEMPALNALRPCGPLKPRRHLWHTLPATLSLSTHFAGRPASDGLCAGGDECHDRRYGPSNCLPAPGCVEFSRRCTSIAVLKTADTHSCHRHPSHKTDGIRQRIIHPSLGQQHPLPLLLSP